METEDAARAPAVSVVVTCHNLGRYLDEAVASVLAQTCQDFEIVIVDDGSTDAETCRLLDDYRRPRTRVLRGKRAGLGAARNRGIHEARGRYLCALDADDRLHPRYFEKALSRLEREPEITFVSTWLRAFGSEDWLWHPERCDLATLLAECTVMTAALVRREAVLAAGGYDEAMPAQGHEDWDLWLTLLERGHKGAILPEVMFEYRRRADSMSATCDFGKPHLDLTRYLVEKHADSYRDHLDAVLLRRDDDIGKLLRHNDEVERQIATRIKPLIEQRRVEAEAIRRRLAPSGYVPLETQTPGSDAADLRADSETLRSEDVRLRDEASALETGVASLQAEVTALRESWSWRATAPLRAAYDLLRGSKGR